MGILLNLVYVPKYVISLRLRSLSNFDFDSGVYAKTWMPYAYIVVDFFFMWVGFF